MRVSALHAAELNFCCLPSTCIARFDSMNRSHWPERLLSISIPRPSSRATAKYWRQDPFRYLTAQIYKRLNRLSALYGSGELSLDQKLLHIKATSMQLVSTDLRGVKVSRRGTRSGRTHSLGGFVGSIEYSGDDLAPFLPLLQAASFTGVGRHTVWGNGEISVEIVE